MRRAARRQVPNATLKLRWIENGLLNL